MIFWDSSAVVPLVIRQPASPKADRWLSSDAAIAVWTMTPVEITSAIWRLVRENRVAEDEAIRAELAVDQLAAASHVVMDVGAVQSRARRLLRVHPLRAADALQLAAALVWAADLPQGKTLRTLDERLALAARREGFIID